MIIPGQESFSLGAAEEAATVGVEGADHVIVQITGTWVATLTFEGSIDGINWFATAVKNTSEVNANTLVTTRTTNGISTLNMVGLPYFRVRMSAWTSGQAQLKIHVDRINK
jgi:hypothetical protein